MLKKNGEVIFQKCNYFSLSPTFFPEKNLTENKLCTKILTATSAVDAKLQCAHQLQK